MVTYIVLATVTYGCCAGCVLAWKARSVLEWHLPYRWAVLAQVGISVAALVTAVVFSLLASSSGFLEGEALVALGLAVFFLAWEVGLAALIPWLAGHSRHPKLLPFRLRRLRWAASVTMLWLSCAVGVAAFARMRLADLPPAGARNQHVAQMPRANENSARFGATEAQGPASTMRKGSPDSRPDGRPEGVTLAPAARGDDVSNVIGAVHAWAAAWAKQDVVGYLGAYADEFKTPNGETRANWEARRRERIENPKRIAVRIESPDVTFADARTAIVRFRQHYESNIVSETDGKTLVMTNVGGKWRILEERRGAN